MRKAINGFGYEDVFFLCATLGLLLSAAGALVVERRLHLGNDRVQYGMDHLPGALLAASLFAAGVGLSRFYLLRSTRTEDLSTPVYLTALSGVFALCWLPVLVGGGFVQDDWMLLAAASVRKIILLHPAYSWSTLDSVDGNFRPIGTVLYFGYMLHWFGASPHAFLAGNFLVNLAGCLVAFSLVRELGYSKAAGAAAALLYMTRGMIYTIVSWACALGDGIVILLCGLMALLILKASKENGRAAWGYHLLAWGCFFTATLAKQSSYAAPLIAALLLLLRPGQALVVPLGRRIWTATAALGVYAATAGITFFHAKALLQAKSPYPIEFSVAALLRSFCYASWYVATIDFPDKYRFLATLPQRLGIGTAVAVGVLVWKVPGLLGHRWRDPVFAVLAGIASISLFVVLGARGGAYYGSMFAFWISIACAIALTRFGQPFRENTTARLACFGFCLLLVIGFLDIRLKQTALIYSGGYTWGTFGMDREGAENQELKRLLVAAPETRVLVIDTPDSPSYYTAMAIFDDPRLERILVYDSGAKTWLVNDLGGALPKNEPGALNDPLAYNWTASLPPEEAAKIVSEGPALWLGFHNGKVEPMDLSGSVAR